MQSEKDFTETRFVQLPLLFLSTSDLQLLTEGYKQ